MGSTTSLLTNLAASSISFHIPSPAVDTNYFLDVAGAAYSVDELLIFTETGECTVGFYFRAAGEGGPGTAITNLDPIIANFYAQTTVVPSANNDAIEDDQLILSVTAVTSPVDLRGHLKVTRG
jgi:hypothetical protein